MSCAFLLFKSGVGDARRRVAPRQGERVVAGIGIGVQPAREPGEVALRPLAFAVPPRVRRVVACLGPRNEGVRVSGRGTIRTSIGQAFRDRIVARLLPPESAAIDVVSREVGVSIGTLERWRAQALAAPGELTSSQRWTPAARLEAVITTAVMDEAARSAWCREQGLFPAELEAWKQDALGGLGEL